MIPVFQTKFGDGRKSGKGGNCFQAAIASVLEVPIEEVPDFCNLYGSDWYEQFIKWLNNFGLSSLTIEGKGMPIEDLIASPALEDCIYLASGKSKRGIEHSVVYRGTELIHDPYPQGTGITVSNIDLIFPMNPACCRNGVRMVFEGLVNITIVKTYKEVEK